MQAVVVVPHTSRIPPVCLPLPPQALMQDVGGGKPVVVNGVEGLEAMEVST